MKHFFSSCIHVKTNNIAFFLTVVIKKPLKEFIKVKIFLKKNACFLLFFILNNMVLADASLLFYLYFILNLEIILSLISF